jgi:hypothetical protein
MAEFAQLVRSLLLSPSREVLGTVWTVKRRASAVALAAATAMVAGGCSHTVTGSAERAVPAAGDAGRSYGYVDNRCGMLVDTTVQETIGAQNVIRPYSGAVCQYIMSRQSTTLDATFSWFETGTLERERVLAAERGAQISDTVIERHPAFLARRSVTGAACSATAAANPGVLSWWVQIRGAATGDPCQDAKKLLAATLSSSL